MRQRWHNTTLSRIGAVVVAAGLLAGCSAASDLRNLLTGDAPDIAPGQEAVDKVTPVAELYNKGLSLLKKKRWKAAAKKFAEVERQHPYSKYAAKAIVMQAFAWYRRHDYDKSAQAAERFITLHPGHPEAPYAYYLRAVSYFDRIGDVRRDATATRRALEMLEEVVNRFPDSKYATDAQKKIRLARDHLAGKEMTVGRYYLKRGNYVAAINRFKTVVRDYQTTAHTPEALYRLTEAYLALGVRSEAQAAAAVLAHNFPNSSWTKDARALLSGQGLSPAARAGSWLSRLFKRT